MTTDHVEAVVPVINCSNGLIMIYSDELEVYCHNRFDELNYKTGILKMLKKRRAIYSLLFVTMNFIERCVDIFILILALDA